MRKNRIRELWASDRAAVNGWLSVPSPYVAEIMAHQGWDGLTIDLQHGPVDVPDAIPMIQAMAASDAVPIVRVPWNEPSVIMRVLDAGAYGIICPMINSREDAERFVRACRYPPDGYRSNGAYRGTIYGGPDYLDHANEEILTFAMIETQEAVDNLDGICSVPGLNAVYIGPSDLSVSIGGGPGGDQRTSEVMERIDQTLEAAHRHGIKAGIHAMSAEYANEMVVKGFDLVTLSSDFRHMMGSANAMLAATKLTRD